MARKYDLTDTKANVETLKSIFILVVILKAKSHVGKKHENIYGIVVSITIRILVSKVSKNFRVTNTHTEC